MPALRPNRRQATAAIAASLAGPVLASKLWAAEPKAPWKLSTFSLDITPPVGHALLGGHFSPAKSVDDPLFCKGLVLHGAGPAVVIASLDWCEIRNEAFVAWREALAKAADTEPGRVLVSCCHQHDAPYFDLAAQRLLTAAGGGQFCDPAFHAKTVARAAEAVKESLADGQRVTHVGTGQAKVVDIASNRRVEVNGKVSFGRLSRCGDANMRAADAGLIDPMLKVVAFYDGDKPLAVLNAYACHPMSYYGTQRVSSDFVGLARLKRQEETPGIFQMYGNGCCGDVTAGKYNDGALDNRPKLTERLHRGMVQAWEAVKRTELAGVTVRNAPVVLPHSELPTMTPEALKGRLEDSKLAFYNRVDAAWGLSNLAFNADGHHFDVQSVDLGPVQIALLPGESFVGYQLQAQAARPDQSIVTLGFGQSAVGYLPTDSTFAEGFRQEHGYCWVRPGAEPLLMAGVRKALAAPPA